MKQEISNFLNLARWAAALFVVIGHVRQIVFIDYSGVVSPTIMDKGFYFLTQLGHEAVMIFFVISGYLVGGLAITRQAEAPFDLRRYAAARISRIYIVLVPALLIFGSLDWIGLGWLNDAGLYAGAANGRMSSMGTIPADALNLPTLLANLASVQGFYSLSPLGTNGPLWSLAYEWWYYCLFGAAFVVWTGKSQAGRLAAIAALLLMLALLPFKVLLWGTIWLLGAGAAMMAAKGIRPASTPVALLLFALVIAGSRYTHTAEIDTQLSFVQKYLIDLSVSAAFGLLILAAPSGRTFNRMAALNHRFADFSYSLYLIHFPLMVFVVAALNRFAGLGFSQQPSLTAFAYFSILSLGICVAAWQFSRVFETRTPMARKWLEQKFRRKPAIPDLEPPKAGTH